MTSTKKERKFEVKDLMDLKLIFAALIIFWGLMDIYHVQDYVRNQEYMPTMVNGAITAGKMDLNNINFSIQNIKTGPDISEVVTSGGYRLTETQFFNAIFMLCVGFAMVLYGAFKWYLWWMYKEFEIKLENLQEK